MLQRGIFFNNGWDSFIAEVSAEGIFSWKTKQKSLIRIHIQKVCKDWAAFNIMPLSSRHGKNNFLCLLCRRNIMWTGLHVFFFNTDILFLNSLNLNHRKQNQPKFKLMSKVSTLGMNKLYINTFILRIPLLFPLGKKINLVRDKLKHTNCQGNV